VPVEQAPKLVRALGARAGGTERFVRWAAEGRQPTRPLLWYHAPSVGEGLMARPVIERVRQTLPDVQVVYTYFSPSAARFAESVRADFADYLPFDSGPDATAVLDAVRPTVLAFSKLDMWPALVEEAHDRGIRVALTSASVRPGSGRASGLAHALLADAYATLDAVGAVSTDDAQRLAQIGVRPERIAVTGDVRYDQMLERVASPSNAGRALASAIGSAQASRRPTLVAGSTWDSDTDVLFAAWERVLRTIPSARLVLAPHEPDAASMDRARRWAAARSLSVSTAAESRPDCDVIVIDRVGVLADLYAVGQVAYVGGGFRPAGLHSVVEPAAHSLPVLFGPRASESRDAQLLEQAGAGARVEDARACAEALVRYLSNPEAGAAAGAAARAVIEQGRGAADRSAALLLPFLQVPATR